MAMRADGSQNPRDTSCVRYLVICKRMWQAMRVDARAKCHVCGVSPERGSLHMSCVLV
jgi:hypothetical protein